VQTNTQQLIISPDGRLLERSTAFRHVGLLNHTWDYPSMLASICIMEQDEIRQVAGASWHSSLPNEVDIRINKSMFVTRAGEILFRLADTA
jgi:hypothetical protein